jgi:hypothetical protein
MIDYRSDIVLQILVANDVPQRKPYKYIVV